MKYFILLITLLLASCTTMLVNPVDTSHKINHICIERNPNVTVDDFLSIIEALINEHSITTSIYDSKIPNDCEFYLTYDAAEAWDFIFFLVSAKLWLYNHETQIGFAQYRLKNGGGLDLNKWTSVEGKIRKLVDQLLVHH
ncbi:hypothetical protein A9Q99_23635 [Gammaproteobacteria bacterium 45_16_T64]|nr:hypothetical protein A9Q99_23635 [Gammaproteobacteria bacterium 45_16_T64]